MLAVVAGGVRPDGGRLDRPGRARAGRTVQAATTIANVPFPSAGDFLIPDSANSAWNDLGSRSVKGVVYHRLEGDLDQIDAFLRSPEGGQRGLFDIGVDNVSGEIRVWNDPFGDAHPEVGVSGDRAPWANGPVEDPSLEASAFIDDHTSDAVNRDLVSIGIAGQFSDGISDACLDAVARLSAYFAAAFADA